MVNDPGVQIDLLPQKEIPRELAQPGALRMHVPVASVLAERTSARVRVTTRRRAGLSAGRRHVDLYRLDSALPLGLLATERERRIILDQVLPLVATVEAHAALVVATGRDLATIQIIIPREGRVGDYTVRILNLPVPVALE